MSCKGKKARYVYVFLPVRPNNEPNVLCLCEVKVYEHDPQWVAPAPFARMSCFLTNICTHTHTHTHRYTHTQTHTAEVNVEAIEPDTVREHWSLCGRNNWRIYETRAWEMCRGSFWFSRGWTCGMWCCCCCCRCVNLCVCL